MRHAIKLARDEFITEALRAANDAIGNAEPNAQAFAILAALRSLREPAPVRVASGGVDYLAQIQQSAQARYRQQHGSGPVPIGEYYDAAAAVETPLGLLACRSWRTVWRGDRLAWASEYTLDGDPITVREIKAAGLAQRPTKRTRQKKEPTK